MIMNLIGGGGASSSKLQVKDVAPSANQQIILPDSGYDGLSKVNLSAIPNDYVGPNVNRRSGGWYSPSTSNTTIYNANTYITSDVILTGDSALVPSNIKNGVTIFGVNGTYGGDGDWGRTYASHHANGMYADIPFQPTEIQYISDIFSETDKDRVLTFIANYSGVWNISSMYSVNPQGQISEVGAGLYPTIEYRNGRLYVASNVFDFIGGYIYYK